MNEPPTTKKSIELLMIIFLRPLFLMWCVEYFAEDFGLPDLGYWKCFWLVFAISLFSAPYMKTYKEWIES